jgi:hypothetical protein
LWSCLTGDWGRQKLHVVVEDHAGRRAFEWAAFARMVPDQAGIATIQDLGRESLRAWVAAEAELMMTGKP